MKTKTATAAWVLAAAVTGLGFIEAASAGDGTWSVDASGTWSTPANWRGGAIADGTSSTADFSTVDIGTADRAVSLDSARTVGNLVFADTAPGTAANWILNNNGTPGNVLTLNNGASAPTITVNSMGSGNSVIVDAVLAGTHGLTKLGTGTLTLRAVNTYTGTTTVNSGILKLDFANVSGANSILGSGLALGGGTLSVVGKASGTVSQTFNSTSGTTFIAGTSSAIGVDLNGGTVTLLLKTLTRGPGSTVDFTLPSNRTVCITSPAFHNSVLVTDTSNYIAYATVGGTDWATTAADGWIGRLATYQTDYTNGTYNVDVVGSPSPAAFGSNTLRFNTAAATLTLNGASTVNTGGILVTGATSANAATIASGGTGAALRAGVGKELVIINNGALNVSAPIVNSSSGASILTLAGTGVTTLSGANTYTGATYITGGTVQFTKTASLYNGTVSSWTKSNITVASGATAAFNVGGANEFATTDVSTLLNNLGGLGGALSSSSGLKAGSIIGFDTSNATGSTFTVGDKIADSTGTFGGAIGVTKLGINTLVLGGANTYTGPTLVNAGTLTVNGSLASGSAVTVAGGATLGGIGSVLGSVTVSGAIAPGNAIGNISTLTTGAAIWNSTGTYQVDIAHATSGQAVTLSDTDRLVMSSLSLSSGFTITALPASGSPAGFSPSGANPIYDWVIGQVATGTFDPARLTLNTSAFTAANTQAPHFSLLAVDDVALRGANGTSGVTDLVLRYNYNMVPEATTLLLGMVGLTPLVLQRWRTPTTCKDDAAC